MNTQHFKLIGFVASTVCLVLLPVVGFGGDPYWRSVPGPGDTLSLPLCDPSPRQIGSNFLNNDIFPGTNYVQSEMSIAVRPDMPSIILAGANTLGPAIAPFHRQGTYWSLDGASVWSGNDMLRRPRSLDQTPPSG